MGNIDCENFEQLHITDLIIDMVYKGGVRGNVSDDPISILMGCGNQGGFRFTGSINNPKLVVLYSDGNQPDWPDESFYPKAKGLININEPGEQPMG